MGDSAGKMKQFATWFTHGVPNGARLRATIYQARSGRDVLAEVERFFTSAMAAGDGLSAEEIEPIAAPFSDAALVCDCSA